MWWNYLSIPKFQRLHRWSLGMDKLFHPTHYNGCNYLSMLRLKLIHVSERGPRWLLSYGAREVQCGWANNGRRLFHSAPFKDNSTAYCFTLESRGTIRYRDLWKHVAWVILVMWVLLEYPQSKFSWISHSLYREHLTFLFKFVWGYNQHKTGVYE